MTLDREQRAARGRAVRRVAVPAWLMSVAAFVLAATGHRVLAGPASLIAAVGFLLAYRAGQKALRG